MNRVNINCVFATKRALAGICLVSLLSVSGCGGVDPLSSSSSSTSSSSSSGITHATCPGDASNAYQDQAINLPGKIEAEDFDPEGYSDTTSNNEGDAYRTDVDVDIKEVTGGYAIGWMTVGEWLEYTVNVPEEGDYDLTIRSGAVSSGRTLQIVQCDNVLVESFSVPRTSDSGQFKTLSAGKIHLTEGVQVIRVNMGATSDVDLDWINIGPYSGPIDTVDNGVPGDYPLDNPPVPSTACGIDGRSALLAGGQSVNGGLPTSTQLYIRSNNQNREYIIDIPAGYDSNKPYRLFYTSHWIGSTDNAVATGDHGMRNQSASNWSYYGLRRESMAAGEPAIFVAPQSDGATWQEKDNRFLFDDILQEVTSSLCIDESRVFATGFSFGAMITYSLSTNHQQQIRAAVGISPANYNIWLPNPLPNNPIAWMSATGMSDGTTPWDGGNGRGARYAAERRAQDNGCTAANIPTWNQSSPSRHVCYDYQGCTENYPVKVCTYNGGHDPAPYDGGSGSDGLNSWVPSESWKFFTQF